MMFRFRITHALKGLVILSALSLFAAGCKKDTAPPEGVDVLPSALVFNAGAGDVQIFTIKGYSSKKISRIKISTKKANNFSKTELDSTFLGRENFSMTWEYKIENAQADYDLSVIFLLTDEQGNSYTTDRLLKVKITDPYLAEFSGIRIYSTWSGLPDALYLKDLSPRNADLTPAKMLDLRDDTTQTGADSLFGKSWISPAGGRFMRFNGFNYAEATEKSLSGAIAAGTFADRIDQIKQGDIILYNRNDDSLKIEAVIRVLGVFDNPGNTNDYYDIAVKKKP
jgi:hypothetical protein